MPLQRAISAFLRRSPLLIVGASALSLAQTALTALSLWEMRVDALALGEPNEGSTHGKLTKSIGVAVHPGIVTADDTLPACRRAKPACWRTKAVPPPCPSCSTRIGGPGSHRCAETWRLA
ncbi:hypothetical protein [Ralstonia sp. UBA689]|uniref:hypothetical protein n=1 Tax=Ralstonia sp. UBA689 TaxID=1947373 RepID=UPI0025FC091C|nr:hypothetical protein [Ralstonia sp. UBA689]